MTEAEFNSSFVVAKPYPTVVMKDGRRIAMVGRFFGFGAPVDGQIVLMSARDDKQIRDVGDIFIKDVESVEKMSDEEAGALREIIIFREIELQLATDKLTELKKIHASFMAKT